MHIWFGFLAVTAVLLNSIPIIYAEGENIMNNNSEVICGRQAFSYLEVTRAATNNYVGGESFQFKGRARCNTIGAPMWRTPLYKSGKSRKTGCFVIFDSNFKIVDIIFDLNTKTYKPCYIHRQNICPDNRGHIEAGEPVASQPKKFVSKSSYENNFNDGTVGNAYVMGASSFRSYGVGPAFRNEHDQTISFFQHG
ncbi:CSEP0367 putative effector protein [Blumeria hordei DH14]|uniref:CSEP0367 putative effector protein n=1 Tax=Blumeria graminis f. sp. hordei (strain DH14) TaxID=546991 RepID=N1J808_BLUG1|nr:CSEP0367 putative effector protein [Blumeria hordei DH14]